MGILVNRVIDSTNQTMHLYKADIKYENGLERKQR